MRTIQWQNEGDNYYIEYKLGDFQVEILLGLTLIRMFHI